MWEHILIITVLGKQRQVDCYPFKANVVYIMGSSSVAGT